MKLNAIANFPQRLFGFVDSRKDDAPCNKSAENPLTAPAEMAFIPAGETILQNIITDQLDAESVEREHRVHVDSFYLDRFAVTNVDYAKFVAAGGYAEMALWPKEIWPNVLQFVDQTGRPGPRYWSNGGPDARLLRHPVVGVCWFEANAYARWMGKRLPTSSQWQRGGTWGGDGSAAQSRFPWSGGFHISKTNIWISGKHATVEVDQYFQGCTANGVYQLVGNVWEWVASRFTIHQTRQTDANLNSNLIEIRGGAFDTYLESQATCLFRTGQPLLFRGQNVGFRCCRETA